MLLFATTRAFTFKCSPSSYLAFSAKTHMDAKPRTLLHSPFLSSASRSPPREAHMNEPGNGFISLQEWQGWGTTSPLPVMVTEIVEELQALENDIDAHMSFGGIGGKLQVFSYYFCCKVLYLILCLISKKPKEYIHIFF